MKGLVAARDRFFFEPRPVSTIAVVRIAFGLVALAWAVSLGPDLTTFFSKTGVLPAPPGAAFVHWRFGAGALITLYVVLVAAAFFVFVGFRTRIALIAVAVCMLLLHQLDPLVENSGDTLLRLIGLYLVFAPAGEALSVDARRRKDGGAAFPLRAPWPTRLIQLQISVVYLTTLWFKLQGRTWNAGTAAGYALGIREYTRMPLPSALLHSLVVVNLMTWGTLAIEFCLGVLVWNRRARPWVLGAGVLLHLMIELTLKVGFFTWAIFVGYIAFVPENTMASVIVSLRRRVTRRRTVPAAAEVAATGPSLPAG